MLDLKGKLRNMGFSQPNCCPVKTFLLCELLSILWATNRQNRVLIVVVNVFKVTRRAGVSQGYI